MKKKEYTKDELAPEKLTLSLKHHIVRDLKQMEVYTKVSVDELASKALLMFIATHNDFLGKYKG